MVESRRVFPALSGLPGGAENYIVPTLGHLLTYVRDTPDVSRTGFILWVITEYGGQRSTARNYLRTMQRLSVIEYQGIERLRLTSFGQQFLVLSDDEKIERILEYLMSHYLGFRELLAMYAAREGEMHMENATRELAPRFFPRITESAFRYHNRWLLTSRCLQQGMGRAYMATEFGRAALKRFSTQEGTAVAEFPTSPRPSEKLSDHVQTPALWDRKILALLRAAADLVENTRL